MSQHLLVSESADGWRLPGLIDFEPAMRGDREYESAAGLRRYSHLAGWLPRLPEPARPTLDALAGCWFATE